MDAIRKKMHSLHIETEAFTAKCTAYEEQIKADNAVSDKHDCSVRDIGKKVQKLEQGVDEALENFNKALTKLAEAEKNYKTAEEDVGALSRRIILMETENKEAMGRMASTVLKLATKSKEADGIVKKLRFFENKCMNSEVTIEELEKDLREARRICADSEQKFDEISRRLGVMETEMARSSDRGNMCEKKLAILDEELHTIGDNMKQLEVSEEKALAREEKFKEKVMFLLQRLKVADSRAEYGEMNITKINQRIDDIEDEIVREKIKIKKVSDELGDTFNEMLTKY